MSKQIAIGQDNNLALVVASKGLFTLPFKSLRRPIYRPEIGRSHKEVRWAGRVFACTSMGFFRDMLRSYLVAREQHLDAASFLIARALFEVTAMTNYVVNHVSPLLARKRYPRAWDFLVRASMGSYYFREHATKSVNDQEHPIPLDVGKAVKSLEAFDINASKEYSFLSEFSHPDGLALRHYVEMNRALFSAEFKEYPESHVGYLRNVVGGTVALAGIVYRNGFAMAEMITVQRRFSSIMHEFLSAEREMT